MGAQPHNDDTGSDTTVAAGARGRTEPLASILEYVTRVNEAGNLLWRRLLRLGDEFLVCSWGHNRILAPHPTAEDWYPGAIVIGPPGIFLIWPVWGRRDAMLVRSSDRCRQQIYDALGPNFLGAVEIVLFSPGPDQPGPLTRCLDSPAFGVLPTLDVLAADGDLARSLTAYEPEGGLQRLSPAWIEELRRKVRPASCESGADQRPRNATAVDSGMQGRVEPLASMLRYSGRMSLVGSTLEGYMFGLRKEFLVYSGGYSRVQEARPGPYGWYPGAIVIGPPGVFIIWPAWNDVDATLINSAERCRQHFVKALGPDFGGAIETVIYTGREQENFTRVLGQPMLEASGFSMLLAHRDLARLLRNYEPASGLRHLSAAWLEELRQQATPRYHVIGPDRRARD